MNTTSAAGDFGKAAGGIATGAAWIKGAVPLAAGARVADGEVQAPTQINAPSTTVNDSVRTRFFEIKDL